MHQVLQSFQKSCSNLHTEYLDSLLLHSPMPRFDDTLTVWRVFERLHSEGRVRAIGISNLYDLDVLKRLYESAVVKPSYIQNRFYAKTSYDVEIRKFCKQKGIEYQSFWSLTANKRTLET
jgi:diketogulonate reductase-like aldo/keto reductase